MGYIIVLDKQEYTLYKVNNCSRIDFF